MFDEDFSLFREQKFTYWNSNKRLNIWDGPVRSGKTVISIVRWIKFVGKGPPGDLIMVGKTNGSLYRNIIRPMQELLGDEMNYQQEHDTRVVNLWGRKIYCFGANDERSEGKIRGMTAAGAYGDEITLWPESFWNMLLSRLSVEGAQFFGSTNPDNPNHYLKKNVINRKKELSCNVFHWSIDSNLFLPLDYIKNLKAEYTGLWYRRYIKGEWCVAEGSIYDFFDENKHILKHTLIPRYHMVSVDYGTGNPTSFGLYGINPNSTPRVWRIRSYWWDSKERGSQKTDEQYSTAMGEFLGKGTSEEIRPRAIIVDPSAASFKLQLRRDHSYFVKDAINDVLDGIRTQAKMLQSGQYMICDHPTNKPCIDEYYGYVWDDNAAKKGEDKPLKHSDHTKDDERYMLHTEFGGEHLDYSLLNRM